MTDTARRPVGARARIHRLTPLATPTTLTPLRRDWEAYILRAPMHTPHRHVALTLAAHAHYTTGLIPQAARTARQDLVTQTGLADHQVDVALAVLQNRCLIHLGPDGRITGLWLPLSALTRTVTAPGESPAP